jgi:hypothetical protein
MMFGVDYAGGRPDPRTITRAGYSFVCRYLSPGGVALPGKQLLPEEYAGLAAAGVAVVVNWETTDTRMLGGYGAGAQDALSAQAQIRKVGHPTTRPVFFSADFDATTAQQAEIDDYLRGAASVLGPDRVGVYGSYYVVKRCLDNHTARWAWQAMAWSAGRVEPRAQLVQRIGSVVVGGVECDVNYTQQLPDYGQHPLPLHTRRERDMNQLPATDKPTDLDSDPATWPQRNFNVEFDPGTGWAGVFGVQDWGGRTKNGIRGFLRLASWETPGGLVPVSLELSTAGGGIPIYNHAPTAAFVAPAQARGLTLNYAAPGGASVGT